MPPVLTPACHTRNTTGMEDEGWQPSQRRTMKKHRECDLDEKVAMLSCRVDSSLWEQIEDAVRLHRTRSQVIREALRRGLQSPDVEPKAVTRG
jgi:hypothetical protein